MNITKSTLRDTFLLCLLPVMSLFSFLFYVFWAYPVQILSQELKITGYFLFNNPYLQTSFLVCVILFIALIITSKNSPKLFPYILGLILVFLIGTFLYKLTSYDFGTFIDNNSLTTSKSILGYSYWYFALDGIIPITSIIITILALKKDFYKPILLIFFLFYTIENTLTLSKLKIFPIDTNSFTETVVLSKNHPNLLFFMFDSISTPLMLDIITNQWDDEQKVWTKDFTFYDNVTALSLGGTVLSLPNMIGGYEFAPQNLIHRNIKMGDITPQSLEYYPISSCFQTDRAFQKINKSLDSNINISLSYADCLIDGTEITSQTNFSYQKIPIINVSLYLYTPYLFKNNLAANRTATFSWHNQFPVQWIITTSTALVSSQETEKPVFYYFENQGTHGPHSSPTYPLGSSGEKLKSILDMKDILYHQITYNMRMLNNLIMILKKQNIYNSTRILVVSDHGVLPYSSFTLPYLQQISTPNQKVFYSLENQKRYRRFMDPPVIIIDKDFNTTQKEMQMDSRFLSLGDLHGSILNTFSTNTQIPDYLATTPPKRIFNIPFIEGEIFHYFNGEKNPNIIGFYTTLTNKLLTNNKVPFFKMKSVKEGDFEIDSYDFDNIGNLPAFEILE